MQHDRNFLRHRVLPLLARRWPGYRQAWGKSRLLLAEASDTLTELAEQDLQAAGLADNRLALATLSRFSDFRLRNALRHWLRLLGVQPPGWQQLCAAARMIWDNPDNKPQNCKAAAVPKRKPAPETATVPKATPNKSASHGNSRGRVLLQGADYRLQTWGRLPVCAADTAAICHCCRPVALATGQHGQSSRQWQAVAQTGPRRGHQPALCPAEVRFRRGGEQLHLAGRPDKSLKKLFQEHRIPPWVRPRTPLLFIDDTLVWVAGIGIAAFAHAGPDETGTELQWQPPQLLLQPG